MKQLIATSNVSLVQSLRIALDAEEIRFVVGNELMAPIQPMIVWVVDEDYEEARVILDGLQSTPRGSTP